MLLPLLEEETEVEAQVELLRVAVKDVRAHVVEVKMEVKVVEVQMEVVKEAVKEVGA